jgi:hypothetical protein
MATLQPSRVFHNPVERVENLQQKIMKNKNSQYSKIVKKTVGKKVKVRNNSINLHYSYRTVRYSAK